MCSTKVRELKWIKRLKSKINILTQLYFCSIYSVKRAHFTFRRRRCQCHLQLVWLITRIKHIAKVLHFFCCSPLSTNRFRESWMWTTITIKCICSLEPLSWIQAFCAILMWTLARAQNSKCPKQFLRFLLVCKSCKKFTANVIRVLRVGIQLQVCNFVDSFWFRHICAVRLVENNQPNG